MLSEMLLFKLNTAYCLASYLTRIGFSYELLPQNDDLVP